MSFGYLEFPEQKSYLKRLRCGVGLNSGIHNELISENGVSKAAPDFAWVSYLDRETMR